MIRIAQEHAVDERKVKRVERVVLLHLAHAALKTEDDLNIISTLVENLHQEIERIIVDPTLVRDQEVDLYLKATERKTDLEIEKVEVVRVLTVAGSKEIGQEVTQEVELKKIEVGQDLKIEKTKGEASVPVADQFHGTVDHFLETENQGVVRGQNLEDHVVDHEIITKIKKEPKENVQHPGRDIGLELVPEVEKNAHTDLAQIPEVIPKVGHRNYLKGILNQIQPHLKGKSFRKILAVKVKVKVKSCLKQNCRQHLKLLLMQMLCYEKKDYCLKCQKMLNQ